MFDFTLEWTPSENEGNFAYREDQAQRESPADSGRPSFATALQEQLGLKLETSKGLVDVFVIDHVEKPSEN
jgi:uncharacterized protein (TIGR03435 family)